MLNARLTACRTRTNLSITDMAHWFGVHRQTMETWLRGVVPQAHKRDQIVDKLELLEHAAAETGYFPIPLSVTQFQRKDYLQQVLNAVSHRVSKAGSAG